MKTKIEIRPQPGPQTTFLSTPADIAITGGGAGGGKALDISTPIITDSGWSSMGELSIGDTIFAIDGTPTKIVWCSDIMLNHNCYELDFSDGSVIIADEEHLWFVNSDNDRKNNARRTDGFRANRRAIRPSRGRGISPETSLRNSQRVYKYLPQSKLRVLTTKEIFTNQKTRGRTNYSIPVADALKLPHKALKIDPYLLGIWLGDGTTTAGSITTADKEIIQAFAESGFEIKKYQDKYSWGVTGLKQLLRSVNVFNNKHIPLDYLRSSTDQRLALLQGLMDTDGYCDARGECEFTSTNQTLAFGVRELILSLGMKANIKIGDARLNGRYIGPKYRIKFISELPVFRLNRKLSRQKTSGFNGVSKNRYIVSVKPVKSLPVRCIKVDHPSSSYLASENLIPTHNTFSLLLEPLRHIQKPKFNAVIFRRTYKEVTQPGGLWDISQELYRPLGSKPIANAYEHRFPSGAKVRFAYMANDDDRYQWDGSQIPLIEHDQCEQFTWRQYSYMFGRNRSDCGVRPYMRGSCNPDPDCFLRSFMSWWIDDNTGLAIPERSGKIRYFAFLEKSNEIVWADSRDELISQCGPECNPLSFTFIPSSVYDNNIMLDKNPGYLASLKALPLVERERLLGGNWNIRWTAGKYFRREWFEIVDAHPPIVESIRYWDRAATESSKAKETGSWTVGLLLGRTKENQLFVLDVIRFQGSPLEVETAIKNTASHDGKSTRIGIEQDPGQAGVSEGDRLVRMLVGYNVKLNPVHESKGVRAMAPSAQAEAGNIKLLRGSWNAKFLEELANYDGTPLSMADQVDTLSGAVMMLAKPVSQKPEISTGNYRPASNDSKEFGIENRSSGTKRISSVAFDV